MTDPPAIVSVSSRRARLSATVLDEHAGQIVTVRGGPGTPSPRRFDGPYGLAYDRVVNGRRVRHALGTAIWGRENGLSQLDALLDDAFAAAGPVGRILDVPCGAGTTLRHAAARAFTGRIVATDLSTRMLRRAQRLHAEHWPQLPVTFLWADALALPVPDASFDAAIAINGLHVMPDPAACLAELARVVRPGGGLHLTTLTSTPAVRSRLAIQAVRRAGVIPREPPTPAALELLLADAGWTITRRFGGPGLTGLACEAPASGSAG